MVEDKYSNNDHQHDDEIDLYILMIRLWEKRNILILFTLVGAFISLFLALFWFPNMYTSTAILMPKTSSSSLSNALGLPDMGGLSKVVGIGSSSSDPNVDLAKQLMTSRGFVIDFLNNNDYLPEVMAADGWDASSNKIKYDLFGYDVNEDSLTYNPSNDDIYKSFLNGFGINTDRLTQFIVIDYLHFSPYFAQEVLDKMILAVNDDVRKREVKKLNKSIGYLNNKIEETSSLELKRVFITLRESNIKDLMLAEIDEFYVLDIIDPPNRPFLKTSPRRALICIMGTMFGSIFGIFLLVIFRFFSYDLDLSYRPLKVIINATEK